MADPFRPPDDEELVQQTTTRAVVRNNAVIKPDREDGLIEKNDDPFGIWVDYVVNNRFERDQHTYMTGVASPGGFQGASAAFFRLTAPTLLWICDWTASRFNSVPDIPNPDNSDSNWVLLYDVYEPANVVPGQDSTTPLYRISGTYIYGHKNPSSKITDFVVFPRPPWMTDIGTDKRTLKTGDLLQGLSNVDNRVIGDFLGQ